MGLRLLGDSVEVVQDVEIAPRIQALMGQTSVREAREVVHAATGAAVATADQPVAAYTPGVAWSTANLSGTLYSKLDKTAKNRTLIDLSNGDQRRE